MSVLSAAGSPRVAHVMAGAKAGGAELFFERLCAAQIGSGVDVLPVIRTDAARLARLSRSGVQARTLGFGGALDFLTRPRLRAILQDFNPRVVVAWMNRAARFTPAGEWVLAGRLGGFYDLSYYRHCDHLIGNTRGIHRWLIAQGWPEARAHYLPNFANDYGACAAVRPSFLPGGMPFVLALGRLHVNKAFDVLIAAMVHVPAAHLVIAGEGPERTALEELARTLGVADRVHLPGWVEDTGALLSACDVLVCPSRHEPLGNVVIEAFSAIRPVVAADVDGPRELISDGMDGMLVPSEDSQAMGRAIAAVIADPAMAQRLARAGRAHFEREYAQVPVLAQWARFLETVEKI